jgi:type II secretory pathway pseudopilin PulG
MSQASNSKLYGRRGTTLFEIMVAIGIIAVLGLVVMLNLFGRKSATELDAATKQIVAILREAQSRSVSQADGAAWGVHFENSTATAPFYALFRSSYSSENRVGYYRLPPVVGYATTSIPEGGFKEITFAQITGAASASTSVQILLLSNPAVSSTIYVASSGAVRF